MIPRPFAFLQQAWRRVPAALLLLLAPCALAAQYPIKLTRAASVGDRYDVECKATIREGARIQTGGETEARESNIELVFNATGEVFAVDHRGHEIKTIYAVRQCTSRDGEAEPNALLPADSLLTVHSQGGELSFELHQGQIEPDVKRMLDLLVPVFKGGRDDDEVFGTSRPQAPGASWPVNKQAAVADLAAKNFQTSPQHLRGHSTLTGVTNVNDLACLRIVSKVEIDHVTVPLPPTLHVEEGTVEAEISGLYPVDPARRRLREENQVRLTLRMREGAPGTEGGTIIESTMDRRVTRTFRPR